MVGSRRHKRRRRRRQVGRRRSFSLSFGWPLMLWHTRSMDSPARCRGDRVGLAGDGKGVRNRSACDRRAEWAHALAPRPTTTTTIATTEAGGGTRARLRKWREADAIARAGPSLLPGALACTHNKGRVGGGARARKARDDAEERWFAPMVDVWRLSVVACGFLLDGWSGRRVCERRAGGQDGRASRADFGAADVVGRATRRPPERPMLARGRRR